MKGDFDQYDCPGGSRCPGCSRCQPYEPGGSGFPEPSWLEKSYKKTKEKLMSCDSMPRQDALRLNVRKVINGYLFSVERPTMAPPDAIQPEEYVVKDDNEDLTETFLEIIETLK